MISFILGLFLNLSIICSAIAFLIRNRANIDNSLLVFLVRVIDYFGFLAIAFAWFMFTLSVLGFLLGLSGIRGKKKYAKAGVMMNVVAMIGFCIICYIYW